MDKQEFGVGKSNPSTTHEDFKCDDACGCTTKSFRPPWAKQNADKARTGIAGGEVCDCSTVCMHGDGATGKKDEESTSESQATSGGLQTVSDQTAAPSLDNTTRRAVINDLMPRQQPMVWKESGKDVDYELRVAEHFRQLQRALDDPTTLAPEFGDLSSSTSEPMTDRRRAVARNSILQAAFNYDPLQGEDTSSTSDHSRACDTCVTGTCGTGSNFTATGIKTPTPNEETPESSGKKLHVAVLHEVEGSVDQALLDSTIATTESNASATSTYTLRIPYRSLTAQLGVLHDKELLKIKAVCDSGAAQTAVSSRWLRKHPELWASRINSEHRFHGVTGEPLQTEGVVRLTVCIANHYISVWAHVFKHMHADMLLGASSIVENALIIDGADCTIYPKKDPTQTVALSYKLSVDEAAQQLSIVADGNVMGWRSLKENHGTRIFSPPRAMLLQQDTVIQPTERLENGEKQALLIKPSVPFAGAA